MWGRQGSRAPRCSTSRPSSKRARRRAAGPETNWLDAGRVDQRPGRRATRPAPWTVNGSVPRPSSSTSTPSARSDRMVVRHRAARGRARRRRTARARPRARRAAAGSASGCRRARSRSWCRRAVGAGVTTQVAVARRCSIPTPSGASASTMSSVSRACSGARSSDGPSASADEHELAVREALRAGQARPSRRAARRDRGGPDDVGIGRVRHRFHPRTRTIRRRGRRMSAAVIDRCPRSQSGLAQLHSAGHVLVRASPLRPMPLRPRARHPGDAGRDSTTQVDDHDDESDDALEARRRSRDRRSRAGDPRGHGRGRARRRRR